MTIFTFLVYLCYLVFQLFSHKNLYEDHGADVPESVAYPSNVAKMAKRLHMAGPPASRSPLPTDPSVEAGPEEEGEKPEMCLQTTIGLLLTVTVVCQWLISLTALGSDRAE
jgi:Ca2+:H+ antiporter